MGNETQMLSVAKHAGNGVPQLNRQYSMIIPKLVLMASKKKYKALEMY